MGFGINSSVSPDWRNLEVNSQQGAQKVGQENTSQVNDNQQQINELSQRYWEAQAELNKVRSEKMGVSTQYANLLARDPTNYAEIQKLEDQIGKLNQKISDLQNEMIQITDKIRELGGTGPIIPRSTNDVLSSTEINTQDEAPKTERSSLRKLRNFGGMKI